MCSFHLEKWYTLYDPEIYKKHYEMHNESIISYFKYRATDLLILNISEADSMERLCQFLNIEYLGQKMPHLNKTYAYLQL
jgi:hypothetical protein